MNTMDNVAINSTDDILNFLFENSDEKYKSFTSSLIPNIDKSRVIGVRTPVLRSFSKKLKDSNICDAYLNALPHRYLEENHLHSFIIENVKDFDLALSLTESFLPYIDNWATCDSFRPKVFKKDLSTLYKYIKLWLNSNHTYTVRYAIGLLNSFYLDEHFDLEHLKLVSDIKSDEYYVNMMIAWYFATALAKQYDKTIPFIENKKLSEWTHNKAIQKALESLRVNIDTKAYLRTLKIKP